MAISKVVYGTTVLMDLTSDTVDAAHLAEGHIAHDAAGNLIVGSYNDYQTTLDMIAGKEVPQEVLDKVVYASSYAFSNIRNKTIKLPSFSGGARPGDWAHHLFGNNDTVERICVPSATYIAWGGFEGANNLKTVVVGTKYDKVMWADGNGTNIPSECKIYVPDSLLDAYKTDEKWEPLASHIKPISELPEADRDLL